MCNIIKTFIKTFYNKSQIFNTIKQLKKPKKSVMVFMYLTIFMYYFMKCIVKK